MINDLFKIERCNICNKIGLQSKKYLELLYCKDCDLFWEKEIESKNELENKYTKFYSEKDSSRFDEKTERIVNIYRYLRKKDVEKFCKKGNLLDVGFGRPIDLEIFERSGWKASGTQISKTAYINAKKRKLDVYYGELTKLNIKKKFDVITFWHVLEHIENPNEYIKKCGYLLNNKGILIIEVPNINSFSAKISGNKWFLLDLDNHLYQFSLISLTKLLKNNNFIINKVSYFSIEQSPFSLLQTFLNLLKKENNILFRMMKKEVKTNYLYLIFCCTLYPFVFVFSIIAATFKRGEVIKIYAELND